MIGCFVRRRLCLSLCRPHTTVEYAVQEARVGGNPLLDKVEHLLGSLWVVHGRATDPVAWPGCPRPVAPPPVPSFDDFTVVSSSSSKARKVTTKSGGRGSGGGGPGDSDISHTRGSAPSHRGRDQASSSASSSSERPDKKVFKKKSRTSLPSSDATGGASSESGSNSAFETTLGFSHSGV